MYGLLLCIVAATACRKDHEITTDRNAKLSFSTDTLLFDTVFTAVGSVNRRIKVYNNHQKIISISSIRLGGGKNSYFSLIINGVPINERSDVQIAGKDSISIFIKATINPNNLNQPFIVEDSIVFKTNGNEQAINLIAYGQNAVFINGETINSNTTWGPALPYIINKSVTVAEGATLTVAPGARILFHGNSFMNIRGRLNVIGTVYNQVLFAGDRTESFYENEAGQWMGIRFTSAGSNSAINYATIKNAVIGLMADSLTANGNPKLLLTNSTVKNMTVAGFAGYYTSFAAFNNLFYNSGQYLLYGVGGGNYNLKQNTFAGFNIEFPRRTAALYFSDAGNGRTGDLNIDLTNNIVWGILTEELNVERKTSFALTTNFRANIIKTALQTYSNMNYLNTDPKFIDVSVNNFKLQNSSPALNKGLSLVSDNYYGDFLNKDIMNSSRLFPSELGCYEHY